MGFVWNLAASSGGVANCKQQLTPPLPFERTMGADKALKCYHVFASFLPVGVLCERPEQQGHGNEASWDA